TLGGSENATRQRIWRVADERMQIRHATGAIPPQLGYQIPRLVSGYARMVTPAYWQGKRVLVTGGAGFLGATSATPWPAWGRASRRLMP
ncbi:MAG: hypothetical protein ACKO4X_23620, partial [Alphaproteobacteria bacterium]